jgi:hypothetical protein
VDILGERTLQCVCGTGDLRVTTLKEEMCYEKKNVSLLDLPVPVHRRNLL